MSSAAPGRLRDFFSSRTGITVGVIGALCLAGATAFALRDDGESDLGIVLDPTTTTTVTTVPPQPAGGVFLRASISSEIRNPVAEKAAVEELERAMGRSLDIHHNFYTFDEAFPTDVERSDLQDGRIPMISWNGRGVTTRAIAAGRYDDLIRQRARDTKALGQPVLVRWFWEMDGKKKAEWAGTPDQYVAAWKHIVGIFRTEGADNVRWVWCPNASAFNDGEAQAFYPGPDFVDWVCGDGYNWAPGRAGDEYRSFSEIFSGFYFWAAQQNKPIMVGEFGVQERKAGEKAEWINATREAIKTDFPQMKAIVYFSANKDYDWRLTTSESALTAFRQMANDPWFNLGVNRRLPE